MMYTYPYYGFPIRYTKYNANYPQLYTKTGDSFPHNVHPNKNNHSSDKRKTDLSSDKISDENNNSSSEKPLFELFGIKLYFDDVLLICLIFFLYQEGVQDQYLFISLILLLLS